MPLADHQIANGPKDRKHRSGDDQASPGHTSSNSKNYDSECCGEAIAGSATGSRTTPEPSGLTARRFRGDTTARQLRCSRPRTPSITCLPGNRLLPRNEKGRDRPSRRDSNPANHKECSECVLCFLERPHDFSVWRGSQAKRIGSPRTRVICPNNPKRAGSLPALAMFWIDGRSCRNKFNTISGLRIKVRNNPHARVESPRPKFVRPGRLTMEVVKQPKGRNVMGNVQSNFAVVAAADTPVLRAYGRALG